ncbi:MAG: tRNA 2-thiocytidine biosynthesis protein TtcA [Fretibacterium sp.]|nr:tRNA 2-thiocytidine biosynthesis protein TtcA [Fretibacterium sp.]
MSEWDEGAWEWRGELCRSLRRRVGRALREYAMIEEGDRVLVGLSGGKDSLVLLHALSDLRRRSPVRFDLAACTVALTGMDLTGLEAYCRVRDTPFFVLPHPTLEILEERGERSPCSLCATLRRGLLSSFARDEGYNKLALGHNLDDAVETFFMNLLRAGRARSFLPKLFQTRTGVTVIRPLSQASAAAVRDEAERLALPILFTICPHAGRTERQRVRAMLEELHLAFPNLKSQVMNALRSLSSSDRWTGKGAEGEARDNLSDDLFPEGSDVL